MMQAFTTVTGPAASLPLDNVDTDVIIRIERLTANARDQLGPYALEALRYRDDGKENPEFVFNRPPFRGAPILITGANFGCGSSREGAVWALMGMGIRCIIAPSFGNIFFGNCFQNGLLPIVLPHSQVIALASACAGGVPMTVDLQSQTVTTPDGSSVSFHVDPLRRESLLAGLDEIALTLCDDARIIAWQNRDRAIRPWVWEPGEPAPDSGR
jgi:3-isopropylmalate/(R)-2-methylmalate dehydratase small subunit